MPDPPAINDSQGAAPVNEIAQVSMRYQAFISYKHAPSTREHAIALESALKRYARPLLHAPPKIFRDERILRPGDPIRESILEALRSSEYLLYIAAEASATSPWVSDELRYWCEVLGRRDRLIVVWVEDQIEFNVADNSIEWPRSTALPAFLSQYFTRIDLFVDLRWADDGIKRSLQNIRYKACINALVARFRSLTPEDMNGEEVLVHRRNRRLQRLTIISLVALTIMACGMAIIAELQRREAKRRTRIAKAQELAARSEYYRQTHPQRSLLLAVEGLEVTLDRQEAPVPAALESLHAALRHASGRVLRSPLSTIPTTHADLSDDGKHLVASHENGKLSWWNPGAAAATPAQVLESGLSSPDEVAFFNEGKHLMILDNDDSGGGVSFFAMEEEAAPKNICTVTDRNLERWILADHFVLANSEDDKVLRINMTITGSHTAAVELPLAHEVDMMSLSKTSGTLATANLSDAKVYLSNAEGVSASPPLELPAAPSKLSFSRDGRYLVVGVGKDIYFYSAAELAAPEPKPIVHMGSFEELQGLQISPDSRWVAAWDNTGLLEMYSLREGSSPVKMALPGRHYSAISEVRFSRTGRWMTSHESTGAPLLWHLEGPEMKAYPLADVVAYSRSEAERDSRDSQSYIVGTTDFKFTSDEEWLVTGSPDGVRLWWLAHFPPRPILLSGCEGGITAVTLSKDDRYVFASSGGGQVRRWPLGHGISSADPISAPDTQVGQIWKLAFSPSGRHLAVFANGLMGLTKTSLLTVPANILGERLRAVEIHGLGIPSFEGHWLLNRHESGIELWDLAGEKPVVWPLYDGLSPAGATWFLGETVLFSELRSGALEGWSLRKAEPPVKLFSIDPPPEEQKIITSRSRYCAVIAGPGPVIRVVNPTDPQHPLRTFEAFPHSASFDEIEISNTGAWLALTLDTGRLQLWSLQDKVPRCVFDQSWPGASPGDFSLFFTEDDSHFIIRQDDQVMHSLALAPWPPAAGSLKYPLDLASPAFTRLADPGVPRLGSRSTAGPYYLQSDGETTAIWNLNLPGPSVKPTVLQATFAGAAQAAPGRRLITGDLQGNICIRAMEACGLSDPLLSFNAHDSRISNATWLDSTGELVTTSSSGQSKLWTGLADGTPAGIVLGTAASGTLSSVTVSADGAWLATGDSHGGVKVSRHRLSDLVRAARAVAGRQLTLQERDEFLR